MGIDTLIAWCHATFNPWWGCRKCSSGCVNCYADALARRWSDCFGDSPRRFFRDAHWNEPRRWDKAVARGDTRRRVFCGSMCDVLEDAPGLDEQRERLWDLIRETPHLDWLLLTKRAHRLGIIPRDVAEMCWLGVTVEDQRAADQRVLWLLDSPARVRFLSCEPLLGWVDLGRWLGVCGISDLGGKTAPTGIDWVIAGGESGPGARPCDLAWLRSVVGQCRTAGVPVYVKQLGAWPSEQIAVVDERGGTTHGRRRLPLTGPGRDMAEWPEDLRVREMPVRRDEEATR
jgi:protein gp37